MKTFEQLREDTSAAVKAFLAKGGKIKKLPPAKAQGYHGKDDPGKDMRGMLDKPDTKKIGTRKKVKSMGEVTMPPAKEIMKHIGDTKHAGQAREILKKKYGVSDKHADKMINHSMGQSEAMISTTSGPFGINPQVGLKVMKKGKEVKPTPPKIGVVSYTGGKKDNPGNKNEANLDELSHGTMNRYYKKALTGIHKSKKSHDANILRGMDPSKDKAAISKRAKGISLAKTRTLKKIRGDK